MVVRGDSWPAIAWALSTVPPLSRYAVMPVARKVWQQVVGYAATGALPGSHGRFAAVESRAEG